VHPLQVFRNNVATPGIALFEDGGVAGGDPNTYLWVRNRAHGNQWGFKAQNNGDWGLHQAGVGDRIHVRGSDGRVGIGTSDPKEKFHVADGGGAGGILVEGSVSDFSHLDGKDGVMIDNDSANVRIVSPGGDGISFWPSKAQQVTITSIGWMGIGVTNPGAHLDVKGEFIAIRGTSRFHGFGRGVEGNGDDADFFANGPGRDFASASSVRWKKNIVPIDNALNKILQIRGVYFDWDEEHGGRHDLGVIGEEVGKIFPEIVSFEKDTTHSIGLDYARLTAVLVVAIKELKTENDTLRQRIEALETR